MKVGEPVLFPTDANNPPRSSSPPGTRCRHQIHDGTGRDAKHPIEVLYEALR
ncbi:hypothetical protein [Rufibacter sp. XAAS-G3-1]|uniref:hypothetical protein n=1 Tax=Rufibacter sp. XAAS-G3-1 TaxID=2729134 RepID=UPI0015E73600|nr:hypothetical protein [Rufibacter sp. XAAS-G3-1]